MSKYTKKQREARKEYKIAGLEKFQHYSSRRGISLQEETYGLYKVVSHSGGVSIREAVRATLVDESHNLITGWVINMASRQRKFIADDRKFKLFLKSKI